MAGLAEDRVLFLTNGREIRVERYWHDGDQIFYVKNGGTFGFPAKLLDRVGSPVAPSPERGSAETDGAGERTPRFRNEIASDALRDARAASRAGEINEATQGYRRAIRRAPDSIVARVELAELYLSRGDVFAAQSQLEQAKRIRPGDATVRELLGDVYYRRGRTSLAIREWQRALELTPGPSVVYKLKKALRENDEDIQFTEVERPNFLLRYDGRVNETIGTKIAAAMDDEYYELSKELSFSPRAPIEVTLYTNREFQDVTHAPSWVSALNDGEIRIPVEGLEEVTPRLRQLLRHELTHSFVNARTLGNCPTWFHEGLAQLRERNQDTRHYQTLVGAQANGTLMPLWSLEGSILGYGKEKALLAYAESRSAVEYLIARRGKDSIPRIIDLLARQQTMNDALKSVVGLDYQQFQTAWETDITRYRPAARE